MENECKNHTYISLLNKRKAWIILIEFIILLLFVLRKNVAYLIVFLLISLFFSIKYASKLRFNKIFKLFLSFWIYYLLITIINFCINSQYIDFKVLSEFLIKYVIVFSTFLLVTLNSEQNNYYFVLFRRFGLVLCLLGIIEFITHKSLFYSITTISSKDLQANAFGTSNFRIFTMFVHPIVYGMFLVILYWVIRIYPVKNCYINKICILLVIINLFATQSRSAWIPFVVTNVIDLFVKKTRNRTPTNLKIILRRYIMFCVICGGIFIFKDQAINAINAIVSRFYIVLDPTSLDGSRTQRLGSMKNIILFIKENPLSALMGKGLGYSTSFIISNPINRGFNTVDNQYVTCILEVGIIGTLFLIMILLNLLTNIKKYYVNKPSRVAIMSIFTIYISIFFYDGLDWLSTLYLLTVFITIIDQNYNDKIQENNIDLCNM